MSSRSHSLTMIASLATVAMTCAFLASCGGGSGPVTGRGGDEMTIEPPQPDLEVATPSVDDASLEPGAPFTLSATVSNSGDEESAATTLRYYLSADATITTSDTEVGTDEVGVLAAAGASDQSIALTAPPTAGTYYYGACVDTVTDESDTVDNCSAPVRVDVEDTPPPTYPDLEVEAPSVNDANPQAGAPFTLSATVANAGDAEAPATTLRYYQSTDATISGSDTQVGTAPVGALAAAGTSTEPIDLTAPSTAGTYYYGACVDAVAGESDTADNCSAPVRVDVEDTPPPTHPDLEVGAPRVDGTTSLGPEARFTLRATVTNAGDGSAAATTLRYYRSTDATITRSDTQVGTDAVGSLATDGASEQSINLAAPSAAGRYYYGACVDAVTDESDTTNNCSAAVEVRVKVTVKGRPDLRIGVVVAILYDIPLVPGGPFSLEVRLENKGDGESAATTVRFYHSTDQTITTSDTEVGTVAVEALAAGRWIYKRVDLTAPSTPGSYYYGACVDPVPDETNTADRCTEDSRLRVPVPAPDLRAWVHSTSDSSPAPGGSFTLSATVSNQGALAAAETTLRYYRAMSPYYVDPSVDTEVGTDAVVALASLAESEKSIDLTAPSTAGTYYYGACVDSVTDEVETANNCQQRLGFVGEGTVEVTVTAPNLEVGSPSVDDASLATEATFTLSATVTNAGNGESAATTLRYYRSTDSTISSSDTVVGTDAVGALAAAGTSDQSIDLTAPSTAGTYYYGACVDSVSGESDATDNCSSSVQVDVQ